MAFGLGLCQLPKLHSAESSGQQPRVANAADPLGDGLPQREVDRTVAEDAQAPDERHHDDVEPQRLVAEQEVPGDCAQDEPED